MSMSQPAISSSVAGCAKPNSPLGVDIAHLPTGRNGPGLDGIVVKKGVHPPCLDQLPNGWLDVAGLVDRPAQQLGRLAVPTPRQAKARPGDGQYWLLQRRRRP